MLTQSVVIDVKKSGAIVTLEKGASMVHTAITTVQLDLFLRGEAATELVKGALVEIGSYRGITTRALGHATQREVWAIDPYLGDGGQPRDLTLFEEHTRACRT